jgi:hypothetical protein
MASPSAARAKVVAAPVVPVEVPALVGRHLSIVVLTAGEGHRDEP